MNKPIDIKWELNERIVVLECQITGKHYPATFYQPAEYPELEIISGEYANGQPLSKDDYEKLYNDNRLYAEVEGEYCRIEESEFDNEVDRQREKCPEDPEELLRESIEAQERREGQRAFNQNRKPQQEEGT